MKKYRKSINDAIKDGDDRLRDLVNSRRRYTKKKKAYRTDNDIDNIEELTKIIDAYMNEYYKREA